MTSISRFPHFLAANWSGMQSGAFSSRVRNASHSDKLRYSSCNPNTSSCPPLRRGFWSGSRQIAQIPIAKHVSFGTTPVSVWQQEANKNLREPLLLPEHKPSLVKHGTEKSDQFSPQEIAALVLMCAEAGETLSSEQIEKLKQKKEIEREKT